MSDRNTQLMKAMGSKSGRYDPEPPDQWRWQLDHGTPHDRFVAWAKSKTIALGHHSAFAVDEHGSALYIEHAASDLGWNVKTARNVAYEVHAEGRIRLDQKARKIYLCAEVAPKDTHEGRTEGECFAPVQRQFPEYVTEFIETLPAEQKEYAVRKYAEYWNWNLKGFANSVAAWRAIAAPYEDNILREIGMDKKRLPKRRDQETGAIQLQLTEIPAFVQTNGHASVYNGENGHVQSANGEGTNGASLFTSDTDSDNYSQSVSQTTKTDRPTELTPILEAFEKIGIRGVSDKEASGILVATRKAAGNLTPPEVGIAIIERGLTLTKTIKSPVRFLQKDVPEYAKSEGFRRSLQRHREAEQRAEAERVQQEQETQELAAKILSDRDGYDRDSVEWAQKVLVKAVVEMVPVDGTKSN